jgi:hypothetical protein
MGSQDNKKNPYSPPTLTKLTPEQAVADREKFKEEEAAIAFLKALSRPPTDKATDQKRKRSA